MGPHKGFFANGGLFFGAQPYFHFLFALQPGYTWSNIAVSLRLGFGVSATGDERFGVAGGFLLGIEGRYYLLSGSVKPYPVMTMNGILGSNSFFLLTLGFGIQYDWSKSLGFFGEISPIGVFAGSQPVGGNYHLQFGGGVQYRF